MKKFLYASIMAGLLASGCSSVKVPDPQSEPVALYTNAAYEFTFSLPADWQGYSVLVQQWSGHAFSPGTDKAVEIDHGPILVLRHPQWKADDPRQDIPILVLTHSQWKAYQQGRFALYDDGLEYEISHNTKYVFAIWSLFNWDSSVKGAREAEGVIMRNQAANAPRFYRPGR